MIDTEVTSEANGKVLCYNSIIILVGNTSYTNQNFVHLIFNGCLFLPMNPQIGILADNRSLNAFRRVTSSRMRTLCLCTYTWEHNTTRTATSDCNDVGPIPTARISKLYSSILKTNSVLNLTIG